MLCCTVAEGDLTRKITDIVVRKDFHLFCKHFLGLKSTSALPKGFPAFSRGAKPHPRTAEDTPKAGVNCKLLTDIS
jgi:hypothetical protein